METSPAITLFLILAIIIAAARGAGALSRRFKQPRVLGELIIGVILGPTLIDLLHSSAFNIEAAHLEEAILEFAELGVLILMFKVGLEVHINELMQVGLVAAIAGIIGAFLPVGMTLGLASLFGYDWKAGLFAGVTLAATSVSISAQVLLEIGVLHTKEGNALLATALVDDVVAILLVSLTIAITGAGSGTVNVPDIVGIVAQMAIFLATAFAIAWYIIPVFANFINTHPEDSDGYGIPAFGLMVALFFGWAAEYFGGVAAITGAFIAGVGLSHTQSNIKQQIGDAVTHISYAFLVPIFFVSVGLQTDLSGFPLDALPFAASLFLVAVVSKVAGCGLGAYIGGFTRLESLRVGTCMISRGEVGLIIASLGISSGVFATDQPLFAALFLVILLTTVITPPFVRRVFAINQGAEAYVEANHSHHTTN